MEEESKEFEVRDKRKFMEKEVTTEIDEEQKDKTKQEEKVFKREKAPSEEEKASIIPEVNFVNLISSFYTNAMISLGVLKDPTDTIKEANIDIAKHMIDTISLIEEKTRGNLNNDEEKFISDMLYNLRMIYVEKVKQKKDN